MEHQKINFPSRSENLVLVEKLIDKVCEQFHVQEDHYGNILVAVTEAVNNAIYHGNKSNPDKKVEIDFSNKGGKFISFKVADEGEGFNFNNIPDPTDPANLEKINGRGVFLMKNLSDGMKFFDHGRIVELSFKIN